ncbi:non-specific lipid transfer protein GPI-anchored 2-like [Chenopodium quinoa]|uniref:non-specific lipid transfer protein GPI-anchored 2-like n=1 Tax=Chenopodium quinoa TaxID=63459 RepID=UPI000B794387|nr:non-specific lipid transfer protein GPI-anchored 2-like [Chenopodium quinoa]
MANFSKTTMWVVVIFGLISIGSLNVEGQTAVPAPSPAEGPGTAGSDCMSLIYNMSDCLTYVEKGSKSAKLDKNCCPELAGMLDTNPICLCQMLGKNKDFPIDLDLKKALKLPSVCGLQTPDVSLCSVAGYPVGAPSAGGPSSAPLAGMSPDAGGMSPEAAGGDSAGKNGASSSAHFNVAYLAAGFAMAFTLFKL